MTTGKALFILGIVLMILTIILAILFLMKKPKYIPENAAVTVPGDPRTKSLKNGYPTNQLTIRREPAPPVTEPIPSPPVSETVLLDAAGETVLLDESTESPGQQTVPLDNATAKLPE